MTAPFFVCMDCPLIDLRRLAFSLYLRRNMRGLSLLLFVFLVASMGYSQTCCTGGVPHLTGLRLPMTASGEVGLNMTYVYNKNADLIVNNEEVESSNIFRNVNTLLLQGDYGLSDRFALSVLIPYIFQKENISLDQETQSYVNNGIGDVSVWGTYQVDLSRQVFFTTSLGVKFPTGATGKRDEVSDIPLPFSFQNGSGSIDFGSVSFLKLSLDRQKLYNLITQLSFRINTHGNRFDAHKNYLFGHSIQTSLIFNRPFIISSSILDLNIGINYQFRSQDVFDGGFQNNNTGGHWINAVLGANVAFNPKFNLTFNTFLPIARDVNGLQLTTTWMANIGIGYVFSKK